MIIMDKRVIHGRTSRVKVEILELLELRKIRDAVVAMFNEKNSDSRAWASSDLCDLVFKNTTKNTKDTQIDRRLLDFTNGVNQLCLDTGVSLMSFDGSDAMVTTLEGGCGCYFLCSEAEDVYGEGGGVPPYYLEVAPLE
jgi:hypothetical protein